MRRKVILLICGLAATVSFAEDDNKLHGLLVAAATNRYVAYLEARADILALGTNSLLAIGRSAVNKRLTWQERLVARICYERLVRGVDIGALRTYDWRTDPGYDKNWERDIVGPGLKTATLAVQKIYEIGLWYYYIELTWKETEETCNSKYDDVRKRWPHWCLKAVSTQPERYWYQFAVEERMASTPFSPWHRGRYETFLREKTPDAVPILIEYAEQYFRSKVAGNETYPGARDVTFRGMFTPVLSLADSRHADMLEKFIAEKPALEPLKKRLAEVRARPAPPPQSEPPFRLGTNAVVIAP